MVAHHSRKTPTKKSGSKESDSRPEGLLSDTEVKEVLSEYEDGITAVQLVEIFASRGVKFSEATFRKYVQQGLLPRSRRVGRKGKHRGSLGLYPAKAVQRVNEIKRLMLEGFTIEEIQVQFLQYADIVEQLEEGLNDAFALFESDLQSPRFDKKARRSIEREMVEAQKSADELLERIHGLSQRFQDSRGDSYRNTGAAGSAEDLL